MFSRRAGWSSTENPIARAVAERRRAGLPVLDLTETNPTRVALPMPRERILEALAHPAALSYDPAPFGLASARAAVARVLHGDAVPPDHVVLTASTSEAYSLLFKLLCDPGDRVLVPAPSYPLFEFLAGLEAVELTTYPCRFDGGWYIDLEAVEELADERTRAVLVVSPNNPTGARITRDEAASLTALCRRRSMALICDEVFADYPRPAGDDRLHSLAGRDDALVFALNGLSKTLLLPQLKLAWTVASGPPELLQPALQRLEVVADTYLSVGAPVQLALPALLELRETIQSPLKQRLARNYDTLARLARGTAVTLLPCDGGWSAVLRVPRTRSEEQWVLDLLRVDGVLVHPGWFFDFETEGWLVVSLLVPEDEFAEGARMLCERAGR